MKEKEEAEEVKSGDTVQMFVFELSDEDYAIEIDFVKEITKAAEKKITPLPNVPDFIKGITNVRGQVVPVIDLEDKFDLTKKDAEFIVILEMYETTVGMLVDDVEEVMRIDSRRIKESPKILEEKIHTNYMKGVAVLDDRLIIILDLQKGFGEEEAVEMRELTETMSDDEEEEEVEDISEEELKKRAAKKARNLK